MNLHGLTKSAGAKKSRKRVGRGSGSGTGKTCGRGEKGQMSRKGHKHKVGFEGGQMRLIRRLPKRGFKNINRVTHLVVNVEDLACFEPGTDVTPEAMRRAGLAKGTGALIKVLGYGEIDRKLTVKADAFSASAKAKIENAGGTCEVLGS